MSSTANAGPQAIVKKPISLRSTADASPLTQIDRDVGLKPVGSPVGKVTEVGDLVDVYRGGGC